jgi:hypothetical protein
MKTLSIIMIAYATEEMDGSGSAAKPRSVWPIA